MKSLAAWSLALGLGLALPAQIGVQSVYPTRNATFASAATLIEITFATPIDPSTVSAASVRVFGRWSGPARGALTLADAGRTIRFVATRAFFVGERVSVNLSSAIASVGGARLLHGYTWTFWIQPRAGTRALQLGATLPLRVGGESPIGAVVVDPLDIDRDGAADLCVASATVLDVRVLHHGPCAVLGLPVRYALFPPNVPDAFDAQDFDGDGWTDLVVANGDGDSISILFGDGRGSFRSPMHLASGRGVRGVAVLDLEGDGDIDIVTANRTSSNLSLHRSNGVGGFAAATSLEANGDGETAVAAVDMTGDGIADLVVGCFHSQSIVTLQGLGGGAFQQDSFARNQPFAPERVAVGDVDRDGAIDAAFSSAGGNTVIVVYKHPQFAGYFRERYFTPGPAPRSVVLADVDGDGFLDLLTANAGSGGYTVLWNDGLGGFQTSTRLAGQRSGASAAAWDRDRDGDLDVVGIDDADDLASLFAQTEVAPPNVQPPSCAASLRLNGLAGSAGFGTRPAQRVIGGRPFVAGVTGGRREFWALFGGIGVTPGLTIPYGLFHLVPTALIGLPAGILDDAGEAQVAIPTPGGLPPGLRLTVQGATSTSVLPGAVLTNPETVVTR